MIARNRGVSLLEMIMAVSILASGILMVLTVLPQTYSALRQNEEAIVGARFCERLAETYRRKPYPALQKLLDAGGESGEQQVFAMLNGTQRWLAFSWQVRPAQAEAPSPDLEALQLSSWDMARDTVAFTVNVSWTSHGGGSQTVFRSLLLACQLRRGDP